MFENNILKAKRSTATSNNPKSDVQRLFKKFISNQCNVDRCRTSLTVRSPGKMCAFDRLERSDKNRQLFHGWRENDAPIFGRVAGDEECIVPLYRKRPWQEDMCGEFKLDNRAGSKIKKTYFRENMKPDYKASPGGLLKTKTGHKKLLWKLSSLTVETSGNCWVWIFCPCARRCSRRRSSQCYVPGIKSTSRQTCT